MTQVDLFQTCCKSLCRGVHQPGAARSSTLLLVEIQGTTGDELTLKKEEVKKGDSPSWAGSLFSYASGSATFTHMELYK